MGSVKRILIDADEHIKQGRIREAKLAVKPLLSERLSPSHSEKLAELLRRLGHCRLALRVLRPMVVGYGRKLPISSANAKIEYAASLILLDLVHEGRKFLNLPDVKELREAKRWRAMSFLYDFQLDQAASEFIPLLKEYDASSYEYLVLKMNLLAALLASVYLPERKQMFQTYAKEVRQGIRLHRAVRLQKSFESLLIQEAFFSESEQLLETKETEIESELEFFKAFSACFHEARAGRVSRVHLLRRYQELRSHAQERNWFEAVREIDLHYSRNFNPKLLALVKMGTRFPHYQARHLSKISSETHYCFVRSLPLTQPLNFESAFELNSLPDAGKLRELYRLFLNEQYAPLTPHAIWVVLAKDEHFISPHSNNRVHQWVKRLKLWIKKKRIPVVVSVTKEGYRLIPNGILKCDSSLLRFENPDADLFSRLKNEFPANKPFSIHDLSVLAPELTLRELQYRLKKYLSDRSLVKTGKARRVRYFVPAS